MSTKNPLIKSKKSKTSILAARGMFVAIMAVTAATGTVMVVGSNAATASRTVYFSSNRTGNYEIYKKNLSTGGVTRLTKTSYDNMNPSVSPDGSHVAFYSNRQSGINQIYSFPVSKPQSVTRLTNDGASDYDPAYMPDGRIVYKSNRQDGYGDIWIMNNNGSGQVNLTPSMSATEEWKPAPLDSTHLVFTSRQPSGGAVTDELYELNLTTGAASRLTNNTIPDWYPSTNFKDPGKFFFISKDVANGPDVIYSFDIPTGTRTRISPSTLTTDIGDPSMSPDGLKLAVVENTNGGYTTMLMMNPDGTAVQTIDKSPSGQDLGPALR